MENRTTKTWELFSLIKLACFTESISELKYYAGLSYHIFNNEDDGYFQVLAIKMLSVCYVRYFELNGHETDTLVINYSDLQKDTERDFKYAEINPNFIVNCRNSIYDDLDEKVKSKLDHVIRALITVPCFSRYFYNHEDLINDFVTELLYKKEDVDNIMKINKEYSLIFYLDMVEFYNPYAYENQAECPTSFTIDKYKELLDEIALDMDNVLKKSTEIEIGSLALNIIFNVLYREGNKEISEKGYFILEKIVRQYCIVKKQEGLLLSPSYNIVLDFNLFIVIKGIARLNNRDDQKVVAKIESNYNKIVKDYARLEASKLNNQPKPVNKPEKGVEEVAHSKRWKLLAFVSFVHLAIFAFLWKTFEDATLDPQLNQQIVDVINSVVGNINKGLMVSLFDEKTLLSISQVFFYSGVASLVAFILYVLLSKSINSDERKGKVCLFIVTLLYGVAKLPISTLIAAICIIKSKKYLENQSIFIKIIVAIIPILVFALSCMFI